MANDRNGKRVQVDDRIKVTGTIMEIFSDGRCSIEMDFCSKRTRCVAFSHQIELAEDGSPEDLLKGNI